MSIFSHRQLCVIFSLNQRSLSFQWLNWKVEWSALNKVFVAFPPRFREQEDEWTEYESWKEKNCRMLSSGRCTETSSMHSQQLMTSVSLPKNEPINTQGR